MNNQLIFLLILGMICTILGGAIVFSDKILDSIYKQGIWRRDGLFDEKEGRKYDKYVRGGGIFGLGIIIFAGSIIALYLAK